MPLLQQPSTDYSLPRAHVLWKPQGSNGLIILGDVENLRLNVEVERIQRYGKNYATQVKTASHVRQVGATVSYTLMQFLDVTRAHAVGSDLAYHEQAAETAQTVTFDAVEVGRVYDVGRLGLTNVTVTDGAGTPVAYTAGTHYLLDEVAGLVQVLAKPETADTSLSVTYDCGAIAATDKRQVMGIGANTDLRGMFLVRGVSDIGRKTLLRLHDVLVSPSGAPYVGGDDYESLDFEGEVQVDPTQPDAYKLGIEIGLE